MQTTESKDPSSKHQEITPPENAAPDSSISRTVKVESQNPVILGHQSQHRMEEEQQ